MSTPASPVDPVVVFVTWPADRDPLPFARALVEAGLAACVNVSSEIVSVYRWQGAVQQDPERQLVVKTTRARLADLEVRVRELHPYDVPEFLVLPVVAASDTYARWLVESTGGDNRIEVE